MSGTVNSAGSKSGVIGNETLQDTISDYEDGRWTPTFNGLLTDGSTFTGTVNNRVCNYVRIGNIVNYWIDVYQSNNLMSWPNSATISGVPTFQGLVTSFHSSYDGIVWKSSVAHHCQGYTRGNAGIIYLTEAHSGVRHLWLNGMYALEV